MNNVIKLPDGSGLLKEHLGSIITITVKGITKDLKKSTSSEYISNRQWLLTPKKADVEYDFGYVEFIGYKRTKTANADNLQKLLKKYKLECVTYSEDHKYEDVIISPYLMAMERE